MVNTLLAVWNRKWWANAISNLVPSKSSFMGSSRPAPAHTTSLHRTYNNQKGKLFAAQSLQDRSIVMDVRLGGLNWKTSEGTYILYRHIQGSCIHMQLYICTQWKTWSVQPAGVVNSGFGVTAIDKLLAMFRLEKISIRWIVALSSYLVNIVQSWTN